MTLTDYTKYSDDSLCVADFRTEVEPVMIQDREGISIEIFRTELTHPSKTKGSQIILPWDIAEGLRDQLVKMFEQFSSSDDAVG